MKRMWMALGLMVWAAGCAAPAGPGHAVAPEARPGFVKKTLENGLVILCQENRAAPIAIVQSFVRAGSMFEEEYLGYGISHFCEHLVAGGTTANRSEKDTERLLDELGGSNNAYTSTDTTSYFIRTTGGKNFETACEIIADWMQNASITQEEFDREYQVIQREIEKGKTEANRVLWQTTAQTALRFHPARQPVIGHINLFRKTTRDDIITYYRRMYAPDNMVIVAVGDFDARQTAERIAGLFRDAKPSGRVQAVPQDDPPQQGMRSATVEMDVQAAYLSMSFRTVPLSHADLYPLDVMSYILSNGASSRLVQRLRERDHLVDSISSWSYTPWYGAGEFNVRMVLKPENIEAAKAAVLDELNRLKTEPVTAAELSRARKQKVADQVFYGQTIEQQARSLGGNYLSSGNPFFDDVYLRGIEHVTAKQIRSVAQRYLSTDNLTVAKVVPLGMGTADHAAAKAEPTSPIEKFVLPNGLRVLVKRNANVPMVTMQAFFLGGLVNETPATLGSSNLLAHMLTRGTRSRSALEIDRAFDDLAGSISGESGNHTLFLQADVLAGDFEKGFRLFADCLLEPSFPDDELAKIKQRTLNQLARQNDDWYQQARNLLMSTLFPKSPYGLNRLGTPESLAGINRETLAAYHRESCAAKNGVLAIFGDVDPAQVRRLVNDLMSRMPEGRSLLEVDTTVEPPLTESRTVTAETRRPDSAVVYAGYRTCSMDDLDDRYALLVLDGVMSGIGWPGGWLHESLRGQGLVYVVHAYNFLGLRQPGYFGAYALTRPDKVDEVIALFDKHVERAKAGLVPEDEFERAKKMAVTVELLGRQTNRSLAMNAALDELYGRGYDFSDSFPERVQAVTREDVLRVARRYLTHRVLAVVRSQEKTASEAGAE